MKNFWKKTAVGLLALLIVAGASPVVPVTKTAQNAAITASAIQASVTYIDADGTEQSISEYTVLDENTTELTEGWYVVNSTFTNPNSLKPSGDVNIILVDDCTMTIESGDKVPITNYGTGSTTNLTIYGQIEGTGNISLISDTYGTSGVIEGTLTINGGVLFWNESLYISGTDPTQEIFTLNAGRIVRDSDSDSYHTLELCKGKVSIKGGQADLSILYIRPAIELYNSELTLGYTKATDSIRIDAGSLIDNYNDNSVSIADGMVFTDGTNTYDSSTPSATLKALSGVTLIPANARNVDVTDTENGKVNVPAKAFAGDTVTLNVAPAEGYVLKSLTVKDADENTIAVTKNQFTMPDGDVTVTAEFKALPVFPADGMLTIGEEYAFTPDEDGVYNFKITNGTASQALLIKGADGVIADIQSAHLKAGETYIIRVNALPTIGDPGQAEVTWEKLTAYNINLPDSVENGALKLYRVNYTALYNTTDTLALAGEEMAIVPTAEDGCALSELTVTAGGNPVELTKKESETNQGTIAYYSFIMPEEDVTVSAGFAEKAFSGASLTLGDDLGLNFYSDLITDENYGEYTVKFSGKCVDKSSGFTEKDGQYRASAHIYAKDINAEITATLFKGDEQIGAPLTYSAAKYLEVLDANTDINDKQTHELITATVNFGNVSEEYFYGTEAHSINAIDDQLYGLLGIQNIDMLKEELAAYAADFTSDEAKLSLVLDSKTAIRLYVKDMPAGTQDDSGKYTSVSGANSTEDYPSYFEIDGLLPQDFAEQQTITANGKIYTFSALSWAERIVNQESPSQRNMTMAKAVTAYYIAAREYMTVDLSKLTGDFVAKNGQILTGKLIKRVKISVADGASVTLKDVTIDGVNDESYKWAGISCDGDAKLILKGINNVKGFYAEYPGVYIAQDKTLTIDGTGTLNASSNEAGAGIGGNKCGNIVVDGGVINATGGNSAAGIGNGYGGNCGYIIINGGTIIANGGNSAAGIGSGHDGNCENITINGGTVTANGGESAAGIGSGYHGYCGKITISNSVTKVTAIKGEYAPNSIGAGDEGSCGIVTIADGANVVQN